MFLWPSDSNCLIPPTTYIQLLFTLYHFPMPITPIIRNGESSSMGAFRGALYEHRRRTQPSTPPIASSRIQTPNSDHTPTPGQRESHVFNSQLSDTDRSILTVDFETDGNYYIYNEWYMMCGLSGGRTPQGVRNTLRSIIEKRRFTETLIIEELQYGNPSGNA